MPINFVDGLGFTVNGDTLTPVDCKVAWERVEKVWGWGEIKFHGFWMLCLTKLQWNNKGPGLVALGQGGADPSLP